MVVRGDSLRSIPHMALKSAIIDFLLSPQPGGLLFEFTSNLIQIWIIGALLQCGW